MVGLYYILDNDGRTPLAVDDIHEWGRWMQKADRKVALTKPRPNVEVSTVFLGLDHNFIPKGTPILFETMIFGGPLDEYQRRYRTWGEAKTGHERAVAKAKVAAEEEKI